MTRREAIQRTPPEGEGILPDDWKTFVDSHTTEAFQELSANNKKNASMKKTRFFGSRAGYRGIEQKVREDFAAKGIILKKVDRHLTWLRGNIPPDGDMTEYEKAMTEKIEEIQKAVEAGTFVPNGREDILAKALGKPEHGGRVRGVPDGITITEYFGKAPKRPATETDCLKETINTMQTQMVSMQKMMVQFWQSGEKPSQELLDSFMKGNPMMIMSTQGSNACESTDGSHNVSIPEGDQEQFYQISTLKENEEQSPKTSTRKEQSREKIPHKENEEQAPKNSTRKEQSREKIPHNDPPSEQQVWRECELSLPGNQNKLVASGLVYMARTGEFTSVHDTSLLDGHKKVEIKIVDSGSESAKLPVPVRDELIFLNDAKNSYVQWPQDHIHIGFPIGIVMKKKRKKKGQRITQSEVPTFLGVEISSEFKQKCRTPLLHSLLLEARVLKTSGALIYVPVDDHVLHIDDYQGMISYEELIHWCDEAEIGATHVAVFMRYLSDLSETMKSTSFYGFLFPESLSKLAAVTEDERSDYIAKAMTCKECGRGRKLIFAPYNENDHWMLAAISQSDSTVYWCDPAGYLEPRPFLVETINRAFEKRKCIDPLARIEDKPVTWKIIKCPRQPAGTVLCGYYVCRYMLELVKGRYANITPNFMINAPSTYTVEQIQEVRDIWAEFTLSYKPRRNGE